MTDPAVFRDGVTGFGGRQEGDFSRSSYRAQRPVAVGSRIDGLLVEDIIDQRGPVLVRRLDDDVGAVQTRELATPAGSVVVGYYHEFFRLVDWLAAIGQI